MRFVEQSTKLNNNFRGTPGNLVLNTLLSRRISGQDDDDEDDDAVYRHY